MPNFTQAFFVLLQVDTDIPIPPVDRIPGTIHISPFQDLTAMLIGGTIFAVLLVAIYFMFRRKSKDDWRAELPPEGTEATFARLCQANSLSGSEAYLMRKLVHELQLDNPLLPFVDPKPLADYEQSLGGAKRSALAKLRAKIFS